MTQGQIRAVALCVFHDRGRILVNRAYDPVKERHYYRPLGGGIEFGETSAVAVVREIREELGLDIQELRLLGTLENLFTYAGRPGHELVMVYDGRFADTSTYHLAELPGSESDGTPFTAVWCSAADFDEHTPLFPDGLPELLRARGLLGG
ncbi:NUDIX hydrolase [Pseudomonas citronellolis]|uniref:NUDIX hydrolase n=1 Tax=Pseudomonas citronellolis TaxID=53408 RepID=UPI00209DFA02|nr:NUDIX hydrolase [Pseudomonas citronellolis]MCP1604308.1 8-oxo-dGTP pyrophosphatase MutT (NUDIX family) [Pseudomonas citronellolis]MCP1655131.1 8-oxo-dGTP pyrophosphatase MutT (NUDIX family) [Pseudomonas citronellolis]MCP1723324.1 8-oxo-dGTP pyrophosphatase MutT (NUDIX family) [Pseudomonas citronellolis]